MAFVFVRYVAETAEDTSEGQCVYILKTPRPASRRLAGRSCLRQLVSLEKITNVLMNIVFIILIFFVQFQYRDLTFLSLTFASLANINE